MPGYIEGVDREQVMLFPDRMEDWIDEDHPVRIVDVFVDALDLCQLGFERTTPARTGRPGYHPRVLLTLFISGYLNRVAPGRRLEREAGRNVEVMWLTGRLASDHKTIADFRKDNGPATRQACALFVELCRRIGVLNGASSRRSIIGIVTSPPERSNCGSATPKKAQSVIWNRWREVYWIRPMARYP